MVDLRDFYFPHLMMRQGELFGGIDSDYPDVDNRVFIERWMRSYIRRKLDEADVAWCNHSAPEWATRLFMREGLQDYKKKGAGAPAIGYWPAVWIGQVYQWLQHDTGAPSARLSELVPVGEMERLYGPLHTVGHSVAVRKIRELYL
jgi:hypothetical protein